jgi:hypothetical protein
VGGKGFFKVGVRSGIKLFSDTLAFLRIGLAVHGLQISMRRPGTTFVSTSAYIFSPIPPSYYLAWNFATQYQTQILKAWVRCLLLGGGVDLTLSKRLVLGVAGEVMLGQTKTFRFSPAIFTTANGSPDHPVVKIRPLFVHTLLTLKYILSDRL